MGICLLYTSGLKELKTIESVSKLREKKPQEIR